MDAHWIIAAFVVIDTLMERLDHRGEVRTQVPDAEMVIIAVVAATYFGTHHARAVHVMHGCGDRSGPIRASRSNCRLHRLADWMAVIPATLGERFTTGEVFVIDRVPLPVCRRVRARRCRTMRGRAFGGSCAANREQFCGWRLHLGCRPDGVPVRFQLLPAGLHNVIPMHALAYGLPRAARLLGDKGTNRTPVSANMLASSAARLVPVRRTNMRPHAWFVDDIALHGYRHTIETVNSQLEKMGVERFYASTNAGFDLKVHAALIALACTNPT